jgi:hypothetical protein
MADNVQLSAAVGSGAIAATDEVTYSGDTAAIQVVRFVHVSGSEGAKTVSEIVKAEDAAHTSGDFGFPLLGVRQDTAASLAGTDGDYTMPIFDSTGRMHVNVGNTVTVGSHAVTNAGTFAVQVDGTALTRLTDIKTNTDSGAVVGNGAAATAQRVTLANDSTGVIATVSAVTSITNALPAGTNNIGDVDVLTVPSDPFGANADAASATGSISAKLRFIASTGIPITGTVTVGSHAVTNAGTFAVQAAQSGTWTVDLGATDNAVLDAIAASLAGTLTVGSHAVTNAGTFAVQESGGALTALQIMDDWDNAASDGASVSGDVAHDAADAGEPVKVGAKAETSLKGITLVADGDRTNLYADADGVQVVKLGTTGADAISEAVSNTDGASTAFTNFSAVASTYNYVTSIAVFRTDAGATLAYIDFRDGTAGSVLWRMPLPAGGGAVLSLAGMPIFKTSANTALAFDVSSALTTVYISVSGYQSKV